MQATPPFSGDIAKKKPSLGLGKWLRLKKQDAAAGPGERRAFFRLPLSGFPPIDCSLVTRGGAVMAALIHNLSAGGLRCHVFEPEPLCQGQPLLLLCMLPVAGRTLVQTDALTIHHRGRAEARSQLLGLSFGEFIDTETEDTLHRYILEKQLELRQRAAGRDEEFL